MIYLEIKPMAMAAFEMGHSALAIEAMLVIALWELPHTYCMMHTSVKLLKFFYRFEASAVINVSVALHQISPL